MKERAYQMNFYFIKKIVQLTIVSLVLLIVVPSYSQSVEYEQIEYIQITPDQVDHSNQAVAHYYINYFDEILIRKEAERDSIKESKEAIQSQRKINRKSNRELTRLNKLIEIVQLEISNLNDLKNEWKEIDFIYESIDLSLGIDDICYEVIDKDIRYAPGEYKVERKQEGKVIEWVESVPAKEEIRSSYTEEVTPASTEWVKKKNQNDCVSSNPEDCYVYCLVKVPATYRTVGESSISVCPEGFTFNGNDCIRWQVIKSEKQAYLRILDIVSGEEIHVVRFEEVNCE